MYGVIPPHPVPPLASLFQDLLEILIGESQLKVSFEDLTGFTKDSPELELDLAHRQHCSAYCVYAKANQAPTRDCLRNKRVCNLLAMSRSRGFTGMCHLGLTEAVEPLIVQGKLLGVFYFGSIVLKEELSVAEERVRTFCGDKGFSAAPYLKKLRSVPQLTRKEWEGRRARFEQTVRVVRRMVEGTGLPTAGYVPRRLTVEAMDWRAVNALTLKAIAYVNVNYAASCTLAACAKKLGCHPVHLSRTFKKETAVDFHEHVHRVRIEHARLLLRIRTMNATRVGYEVGYADASHFTRVFKRITGQTPAAFVRNSKQS